MTSMQKLLTPAAAEAVVERGSTTLGGPVVRSIDVVDLSPAELAEAHGWVGPGMPWETPPEYVDVLRFEGDPLMDFQVPGRALTPTGARPWPTYDLGFLRTGAIAVWELARTRVPVGTEYWRIGPGEQQRSFSYYAGPGVGWAGAKAFRPPVGLTGPRARWRGVELPASFTDDGRGVEVVSISDEAPEGFETTRPGVHRRLVPLDECDAVFEVVLTATWRGSRVRVLQVAGDKAQVQLLEPDAESVARLDAVSLEPGSFEAVAPRAELADTAGTTRELPPDRSGAPTSTRPTLLGRVGGAAFIEAGSLVTLSEPVLTTRRGDLAWGPGAQALYAIWSPTGRPVDDEDGAVELAAGTVLRLVETRLIEGVDVHLVVEVLDDDPGPDLDDLAGAARQALEVEAGGHDATDRFVGDLR